MESCCIASEYDARLAYNRRRASNSRQAALLRDALHALENGRLGVVEEFIERVVLELEKP